MNPRIPHSKANSTYQVRAKSKVRKKEPPPDPGTSLDKIGVEGLRAYA